METVLSEQATKEGMQREDVWLEALLFARATLKRFGLRGEDDLYDYSTGAVTEALQNAQGASYRSVVYRACCNQYRRWSREKSFKARLSAAPMNGLMPARTAACTYTKI